MQVLNSSVGTIKIEQNTSEQASIEMEQNNKTKKDFFWTLKRKKKQAHAKMGFKS